MDSSTSGGSLGSTSHTSLLTAACNASRVLRWTTRAIGVWPSRRLRVGNQLLRDATGEGLERREMPVDDLVLVDPDIERALALAVAGFVFVAGRVPIAPCGQRAIGLELPLDAAADHVAVGLDVRERGFGAGGGIGLGGAVLDLPIPAMVAGEVEDGGINASCSSGRCCRGSRARAKCAGGRADALHLSFRRGGALACPATDPKYLRAIVSERMMYPSPLVVMNSKAMRKVATPELMRHCLF